VLTDAAAKGLPGEHHFFISFDTQAEGVRLSPRLKAQYPRNDHRAPAPVLGSDRDQPRFEVGLSFNGVPERLVVPFSRSEGSSIPRWQFGLQFATVGAGEEPADASDAAASARPPARHDSPQPSPNEPPPMPANPAPTAAKPDDDPPAGGGEVVRLDRFRKK